MTVEYLPWPTWLKLKDVKNLKFDGKQINFVIELRTLNP